MGCPIAWLHEPHCAQQRRHHPSPVIWKLRAGVWSEKPGKNIAVSQFDLLLVLLGRRATMESALVLAALGDAGRRGLQEPSGKAGNRGDRRVAFATRSELVFSGSLWAWVEQRLRGRIPSTVCIERVTPLASKSAFESVLGTLAHDLVQWDLADRDFPSRLGPDPKGACDRHGDAVRERIRHAMKRVSEVDERHEASLGRRRSRSNLRTFPLFGFTGSILLHGDLREILPWLSVLELLGGGAKKSFGLGDVWLDLAST